MFLSLSQYIVFRSAFQDSPQLQGMFLHFYRAAGPGCQLRWWIGSLVMLHDRDKSLHRIRNPPSTGRGGYPGRSTSVSRSRMKKSPREIHIGQPTVSHKQVDFRGNGNDSRQLQQHRQVPRFWSATRTPTRTPDAVSITVIVTVNVKDLSRHQCHSQRKRQRQMLATRTQNNLVDKLIQC